MSFDIKEQHDSSEKEVPSWECKDGDSFQKSLDSERNKYESNILHSRKWNCAADLEASKLGSLGKDEFDARHKARDEYEAECRKSYENAVLHDGDKDRIAEAKGKWAASVKNSIFGDMVDSQRREMQDKTEAQPHDNVDTRKLDQASKEYELASRHKEVEGTYRDKNGSMDETMASKDRETIMNTEPLKEDTTYYRGMHISEEQIKEYQKNGGIMSSDHLTSGAKNELNARSFALDPLPNEKSALFVIENPAGSHILDADRAYDKAGAKPMEKQEVIYAPGSQFSIQPNPEVRNKGQYDEMYVFKAKYIEPQKDT